MTTAPCTHKRVHHPHGNLMRYRKDGCRCTTCRTVHRNYEKRRRLNVLRGVTAMTPVTDVVTHIDTLITAGVSLRGISRESGLSTRTVQLIARGHYQRIHLTTARAILAVTPTILPHAVVDGTGATRRLQALATLGWSARSLSPIADVRTETLVRVMNGRSDVERETDEHIRAAYRRLITQPRVGHDRVTRASIAKTRAAAARNGWVGPFAWDDIDTDPAPVNVDQYTPAPRIDTIRELEGMGLTRAGIADRIGITENAVARAIERARTRSAA